RAVKHRVSEQENDKHAHERHRDRKQYQEWKRQALQQRGQHDKNERYRKPQRETDLFFFFFGQELLARLFSLVSIRELNSGQDILDELLTHLIGAEVFPV